MKRHGKVVSLGETRAFQEAQDRKSARDMMRPSPEECYRALHGIQVGKTGCPECGRVLQVADYPARECVGCGRPWAQPCIDGPGVCESFVEPHRIVDESGVDWVGRYTCDDCGARTARDRLRERVKIIPRKHRASLADWREYEHRRELMCRLGEWMGNDFGETAGPTAIYVHGSVGPGKSVGVARFIVELLPRPRFAAAGSVMWLEEADLIEAAKRRFRDGEGDAQQELLDRARRVDLLVIDEMFRENVEPDGDVWRVVSGIYTDNARSSVSAILRRRFEEELPTVLISNSPPRVQTRAGSVDLFEMVFDSPLASRFAGAVLDETGREHVIHCHGPDLRRRGGA